MGIFFFCYHIWVKERESRIVNKLLQIIVQKVLFRSEPSLCLSGACDNFRFTQCASLSGKYHSGIKHPHQDVKIFVLISIFICFYPSTTLAQLHVHLQLNANAGVLLQAMKNLPTSPYWARRAVDTNEKVISLQVQSQQCRTLELKLLKRNISVQIWAMMHSDTIWMHHRLWRQLDCYGND